MTEIRIPKPGDAITSGSIIEWLVPDGALVQVGDPLYLLETDKAEMEIEAPSAGVVRLIGEVGIVYPVGQVIATIT